MNAVLPRYVWFQGKCWHNPGHPLDWMGRVDLWSLSQDGDGIGADPSQCHPCDDKTVAAIWEAQNAGQLIKF